MKNAATWTWYSKETVIYLIILQLLIWEFDNI